MRAAHEPAPSTAWILEPVGAPVSSLTRMPLSQRDGLRDGKIDQATFRRAHNAIQALREIEIGGAPTRSDAATGSLTVAAWNVERLRYLDAIGNTLATIGPDIVLLTEIDKGMARSGNGHRVAELAARLHQAYAYGVEFVELDLGDPSERAHHAGENNDAGFHGNAILSPIRIHRPFLVRLEAEGQWFGWNRGQPRVGGRLAIGAQVELDGVMVTLVGVHFESHSTPAHRAMQMRRLLDVIDRYDDRAPVLIGGDFNTSTFTWWPGLHESEEFRNAMAADPARRIRVESYEPMFAELALRDYDWLDCNVPEAVTQRMWTPDPKRVLGKIDWFFSRALACRSPRIVPAIQADGSPSSDHECLVIEVALPAR